jgi:hypothetical protein
VAVIQARPVGALLGGWQAVVEQQQQRQCCCAPAAGPRTAWGIWQLWRGRLQACRYDGTAPQAYHLCQRHSRLRRVKTDCAKLCKNVPFCVRSVLLETVGPATSHGRNKLQVSQHRNCLMAAGFAVQVSPPWRLWAAAYGLATNRGISGSSMQQAAPCSVPGRRTSSLCAA